MESTLLIVKPDGVRRGLIGKILSRFEDRSLIITAGKIVHPNREILKLHYIEHADRDYYPNIENAMLAGPIFVFVVAGPKGTVALVRKMIGKTDPMESDPGTIRGDFATYNSYNVIHASDSVASAEREILIWFTS